MSEDAPAPDRGFLSLLFDVFFAPGDAFRDVAARPRWEAPLVLAIAIGLAFTAVWVTKADPVRLIKAQMEETGGMERIPAEQRAEVLQTQAKWFRVLAWVGPLLFAPLAYAALAGLFLFVYRFFYGAEATYVQALAVVAWCFAAYGLVLNPIILMVMALKDEWSVDPNSVIQASGAVFLDKGTAAKPLYALAGSFDLFSFWVIALLAIGFGAVIGKPASSAAWGIVVPWAIYVGGKCALAALF